MKTRLCARCKEVELNKYKHYCEPCRVKTNSECHYRYRKSKKLIAQYVESVFVVDSSDKPLPNPFDHYKSDEQPVVRIDKKQWVMQIGKIGIGLSIVVLLYLILKK